MEELVRIIVLRQKTALKCKEQSKYRLKLKSCMLCALQPRTIAPTFGNTNVTCALHRKTFCSQDLDFRSGQVSTI